MPADLISEYVRVYENHPMNMESDGVALESYIKKNPRFAEWDVLVVTNIQTAGIPVAGTNIEIHPTVRPFSKNGSILSVYGTKMRIGTMGLTKHGLTAKEKTDAEREFRDSKRDEYVLKYGDKAEQKLQKMSIPDRAYLIQNRRPILVIHYLKATDVKELPKDYDNDVDLMVGYGIGFPSLAGSDPVYAVYYVNTVEQRQSFEDEIEEDQLDDIDN